MSLHCILRRGHTSLCLIPALAHVPALLEPLNLQSTAWNVFDIMTCEYTYVTGTKLCFVILALFDAVHFIFLLYFISVFKNNSSPSLLNKLSDLQYWSGNLGRWETGAPRCPEYRAQCLGDRNHKCLCLIFLVTQHPRGAPQWWSWDRTPISWLLVQAFSVQGMLSERKDSPMAVSSRAWAGAGGNSEVVGDTYHAQGASFKVTKRRTGRLVPKPLSLVV